MNLAPSYWSGARVNRPATAPFSSGSSGHILRPPWRPPCAGVIPRYLAWIDCPPAVVAVRLRLDRPRPLASDGPARPAQRQPCWGDDQADHQERGQNVGETHVTAPNDCVILMVLQLMRRPAIELAPRHLPGRARAYRRQVARADRLVVVARDRALVALGRDRPDNRGRVNGPAKPSASINAQPGLFPQAECRPRCRAGCQDDRVFNVKPRRRTGYVDNSLPRVLAHPHCATTTLSLRNPMADPKLDIGGP